jgi:hypothetical protein
LLAHTVGTDGADIAIGYIEAAMTEFDITAHFSNGIAKVLYIAGTLFDQM